MGLRTGKEPDSDDTFLWRICHALDLSPRELAKNIGVKYKELEPLLRTRSQVAEIDCDEVWWLISDLVSKQCGYLMAIRSELSKALQKDRVKRIQRHDKFHEYHRRNK